MAHPSPRDPASTESNKSWSLNDPSIRSLDRVKHRDVDAGLHSFETEALGNDRYRDPQNDQDEML